MLAQIEKLKELWKDLQGEKSTSVEGSLNLGAEVSGLNTDPFTQIKIPKS
jgi:hypothetical protein